MTVAGDLAARRAPWHDRPRIGLTAPTPAGDPDRQRGQLRLWDNEILMGWYAAADLASGTPRVLAALRAATRRFASK